MPQDDPKPRRRDKLLALFGIRPSSRSASATPSAISSLNGSGQSLGDHTPSSSKGLQQKAFKRSPSLEKDLAVLSITYLLQDNAKLRELIGLIVRIRDRDEDDKVSAMITMSNLDS